jgi:hypothetical protein
MPVAPLVVTADAAEALAGVNPFVVGGSILLLLVLLMAGLLAFGAGRDHS